MKLHCYHISPIDYWPGSLTKEQLCNGPDRGSFDSEGLAKELDSLRTKAEAAFLTLMWEGDSTMGPRYFAFPAEIEFLFGYVIKQSNNGSTFVASPVELPWLKPLSMVASIVTG